MTAQPLKKYSPEEYLELERAAKYKSEYYQGEIFAMAGASRNHNRVVGNLYVKVGSHLDGEPCDFFPSDMRVHIPANGLYTYPDLTVVCGKEEYLDEEFDTLLNPKIIIEVLSQGTSGYDRGEKFQLYRSITTLEEYVLIDSKRVAAEVNRKHPHGFWSLMSEAYSLESSIELASISLKLPLRDIYGGTENLGRTE
ncbi:Uma2 family endonuclease [Persicitalea sp.]|uniref:Uma2 family endonuclease n=1 Tax=Persicitalea sp. TaxID=3100273 RepID=UPI003593AA32